MLIILKFLNSMKLINKNIELNEHLKRESGSAQLIIINIPTFPKIVDIESVTKCKIYIKFIINEINIYIGFICYYLNFIIKA